MYDTSTTNILPPKKKKGIKGIIPALSALVEIISILKQYMIIDESDMFSLKIY